jgi:hypothetical protein
VNIKINREHTLTIFDDGSIKIFRRIKGEPEYIIALDAFDADYLIKQLIYLRPLTHDRQICLGYNPDHAEKVRLLQKEQKLRAKAQRRRIWLNVQAYKNRRNHATENAL